MFCRTATQSSPEKRVLRAPRPIPSPPSEERRRSFVFSVIRVPYSSHSLTRMQFHDAAALPSNPPAGSVVRLTVAAPPTPATPATPATPVYITRVTFAGVTGGHAFQADTSADDTDAALFYVLYSASPTLPYLSTTLSLPSAFVLALYYDPATGDGLQDDATQDWTLATHPQGGTPYLSTVSDLQAQGAAADVLEFSFADPGGIPGLYASGSGPGTQGAVGIVNLTKNAYILAAADIIKGTPPGAFDVEVVDTTVPGGGEPTPLPFSLPLWGDTPFPMTTAAVTPGTYLTTVYGGIMEPRGSSPPKFQSVFCTSSDDLGEPPRCVPASTCAVDAPNQPVECTKGTQQLWTSGTLGQGSCLQFPSILAATSSPRPFFNSTVTKQPPHQCSSLQDQYFPRILAPNQGVQSMLSASMGQGMAELMGSTIGKGYPGIPTTVPEPNLENVWVTSPTPACCAGGFWNNAMCTSNATTPADAACFPFLTRYCDLTESGTPDFTQPHCAGWIDSLKQQLSQDPAAVATFGKTLVAFLQSNPPAPQQATVMAFMDAVCPSLNGACDPAYTYLCSGYTAKDLMTNPAATDAWKRCGCFLPSAQYEAGLPSDACAPVCAFTGATNNDANKACPSGTCYFDANAVAWMGTSAHPDVAGALCGKSCPTGTCTEGCYVPETEAKALAASASKGGVDMGSMCGTCYSVDASGKANPVECGDWVTTPPVDVCASYTPSDLTSNLSLWKQCGCYLPSAQYNGELGGVCGPLCAPSAVAANPDVTGCGEGTCYFDDTTTAWLGLSETTSLTDACRWASNGNATCVFDADAVSGIQDALSKASGGASTIADACKTCFTVPRGALGSGRRTAVDCVTFQPLTPPPPSGGSSQKDSVWSLWKKHKWVILGAGGGVLLLLLLLLLGRHSKKKGGHPTTSQPSLPSQSPDVARLRAAHSAAFSTPPT